MANEHTREREPLSPLSDGDFQRIAGIGPGIAQRLHAAGIQTFRQLAAMSPEEICARLTGLVGMTSERIAHQDWPGKAAQLAKEIDAAEPPSEPEDPDQRQHYASFMIELLQDENHTVRRTRVVHVQTGEKNSWAGWDTARLEAWITSQAVISAPARAELPASTPRPLAQKMTLELGASEILNTNGDASERFLNAGQPFAIRLPMKIKMAGQPAAPLLYRAAIQARPITGQQVRLIEASGLVDTQGEFVLSIPVDGLEEGAYRLEASVLVYLEGTAQPEKEGYSAFTEGGLVYVFSRETEPAA